MQAHKFKIGNPCGPCEWHIEKGVKAIAWFDAIFQIIYIVPIVLRLRMNLNGMPNDDSHSPSPRQKDDAYEPGCYRHFHYLALAYSILDVTSTGLGLFTDVFLLIGTRKSSSVTLKLSAAWTFCLIGILREVMHGVAIVFHAVRCSPSSLPYELVTRSLCQYLVYGMWIAGEYLIWIQKGCQFVPKYGQPEPPTIEYKLKEFERRYTFTSMESDVGRKSRVKLVSSSNFDSDPDDPSRFDRKNKEKKNENTGEDRETSARKSIKKWKRKSKKRSEIGASPDVPESQSLAVASGSSEHINSPFQASHERLEFQPPMPSSPYPPVPNIQNNRQPNRNRRGSRPSKDFKE